MTDFERLFEKFCKELKTTLVPYTTEHSKVRIGGKHDGGYVLCDIPGVQYDALYSYGSNDDIQFEKSFFEKYNVESYVYDHTIEGITDKPDYIHFFKEGVSHTTLPNMDTIENHISKNNHTLCKNLCMQMDIEGWEWLVIPSAKNVLNKFAQIIIEFHFAIDLPFTDFIHRQKLILDTLKTLNEDFVCVHIHANNCALQPWFDIEFPRFFEVTYVRRDLVTVMTPETVAYPTEYDFPNASHRPDMTLNWWLG